MQNYTIDKGCVGNVYFNIKSLQQMGKYLVLLGLFMVFLEHNDLLLQTMMSVIALLLMIVGLLLEQLKNVNGNTKGI